MRAKIAMTILTLIGFILFPNYYSFGSCAEIEGGTISVDGSTFICTSIAKDSKITINVSGESGKTSVWVITDSSGFILGIPDSLEAVDFDGSGTGLCLLWHLTFAEISGLEVGNFIDSLVGCFDFSNTIEVNRNQPSDGILYGGPFSFCLGDGEVDTILINNRDTFNQWVITETSGLILGLSANISDNDFDGAGTGRVRPLWIKRVVCTL